jgi:hypothetical protein
MSIFDDQREVAREGRGETDRDERGKAARIATKMI